MAQPDCPKCGGTGYKILEGNVELSPAVARVPELAARAAAANGSRTFAVDAKPGAAAGLPRVAVLCDCAESERAARALQRARIPARYEHCDFVNFETDVYESVPDAPAYKRSLSQAKLVVEGFARDYPLTLDAGLLLIGPCGVGKTHLAVAVLKQLVRRGHEALFYDYRDLLKEIQASYNPDNPITESRLLEPVLSAEVLMLDDLGSSKPSNWALEMIGHILTTRYNEKRVTLLTSNYLDAPEPSYADDARDASAALAESSVSPGTEGGPDDSFAARRAGRTPRKSVKLPSGESIRVAHEDTLGERIGQRIRSRLYEMCRTVEILAPDFRREIRKASGLRH
ncbi:MAG TPA: ATP-binding protein [Candidatus Acidoferrales bacterium]|jgi:DNA replication protein DnaC|nr:ATP-binding protein [Candidatus Acidoferrales bacterium]